MRPVLLGLCALLGAMFLLDALAARRAHALADPSELSVGGASGAHESQLACGPSVRVRHASGGLRYERVFVDPQDPAVHPGEGAAGALVDVRAGLGTTTITSVTSTDPEVDATGKPSTARALATNEEGRAHTLASAQALAGWDWRWITIAGGVGYFGFAATTDNATRFHAVYVPLPVVESRLGRRRALSGRAGLGAPPISGLARWYSLYAIAQYRFAEGGEIGGGVIVVPVSELDSREGVVFHGGFPVAPWLSLGGFGLLDARDKKRPTELNWTAGAGATFVLDSLPP